MQSSNDNKFSWPKYPENDAEFDELMKAIDSRLAKGQFKPFQRPLHAGLFFSDAFNWEGNAIPPKALAYQPGFSGDILMAKANRWYEDTYGDRLKSDWALGYFAIAIANAVWKARVPVFYGTCNFFFDIDMSQKGQSGMKPNTKSSVNAFNLIGDLPQGLVSKLSDNEIIEIADTFMIAVNVFNWRTRLKGHYLFLEAYKDYSGSTDELLKGNFAQSRWASEQSVEKTLKGLLAIAGKDYPKGFDGHNFLKIGLALKCELNIEINTALLEAANCSPKVRYNEETSNEAQALAANRAVIEIHSQLSKSQEVNTILAAVGNQ